MLAFVGCRESETTNYIPLPIYSSTTIHRIERIVEDAFTSVLEELLEDGIEMPDWLLDASENLTDDIVYALRQARISEQTLNEILNSVESFINGEIDEMEFMLELMDIPLSNVALAIFTYQMIYGFRDVIELGAEEFLNPVEARETIDVFNGILDLGQDTLVDTFSATFAIIRLQWQLQTLMAGDDSFIYIDNQAEFRSLIMALRDDSIEALEVLDQQTVSALGEIAKVFGTIWAVDATEVTEITEAIDDFVLNWSPIRETYLAMLQVITPSFADSLHGVVVSAQADEVDVDLSVILLARLLDAGLSSDGGMGMDGIIDMLTSIGGTPPDDILDILNAMPDELRELADLQNSASIDWNNASFTAEWLRDVVYAITEA